MDTLTDIELIIQSQSWKKSRRSSHASPQNFPRFRHMNTVPNLNTYQTNYEVKPDIPSPEIPKKPELLEETQFKFPTLVKLAVPYKELTSALGKSISNKSESVLVPAFPMRKFGNGVKNCLQPIFEKLNGTGKKDKEILLIKKSSGRGLTMKPRSLPSLFSPRVFKEKILIF